LCDGSCFQRHRGEIGGRGGQHLIRDGEKKDGRKRKKTEVKAPREVTLLIVDKIKAPGKKNDQRVHKRRNQSEYRAQLEGKSDMCETWQRNRWEKILPEGLAQRERMTFIRFPTRERRGGHPFKKKFYKEEENAYCYTEKKRILS